MLYKFLNVILRQDWATCTTSVLLDEYKRRQRFTYRARLLPAIYGTRNELQELLLKRPNINDELRARDTEFDYSDLEEILYQLPPEPVVGVHFEGIIW